MGSPGSIVASVMPTVPPNGRLVITVAFAKSSFDGGAATPAGVMQSANASMPRTTNTILVCFISLTFPVPVARPGRSVPIER